jgi:hypothetical protein
MFLDVLIKVKTDTGHTTTNNNIKHKLCLKRRQSKLLQKLPYISVVVGRMCCGSLIFCFTFGETTESAFGTCAALI